MKKLKISLLVVVILSMQLSCVLPTIAAVDPEVPKEYTLLAPLPCVPGNGVVCDAGTMREKVDFQTYVQYAFNLVIALAAVLAVFMIVWGGFEYMNSSSFYTKSEGWKRATNAVYGLILILCSYIILRTIDPRLVEIPSTIVPQLSLKEVKSDIFNELFNDLQKNAQNHIDNAEAIQQIKGIDYQIAELERQKRAFEDQLAKMDKTVVTDEIETVAGQIAALTNAINDEKGKKLLIVSRQSMKNKSSTVSASTNSINDFSDASIDVRNIWVNTISGLQAVGGQSDKIDIATDEYELAKAKLAAEAGLAGLIRQNDPTFFGGVTNDISKLPTGSGWVGGPFGALYLNGTKLYQASRGISFEQQKSQLYDAVQNIYKNADSKISDPALKQELRDSIREISAAITSTTKK